MLSKNKRGYDETAIPQHKRFRQNLADAYLAGQVTAARAASLFTDAEAAGATGVEDLARLGGKDANRSLRRKLLKQGRVLRVRGLAMLPSFWTPALFGHGFWRQGCFLLLHRLSAGRGRLESGSDLTLRAGQQARPCCSTTGQALLEQDSVLESQEADPGNGRDALFAPP